MCRVQKQQQLPAPRCQYHYIIFYHIIHHFIISSIMNIRHLCFMRLLSRVLSQRVWPSSLCGRSTPRLHKPPEPSSANCFTKNGKKKQQKLSKDEKLHANSLHPRNSRPLTQVPVTALEPRASLEVSASPCARGHKWSQCGTRRKGLSKDPDSRAKNCVSREAMAIAYEQIHGMSAIFQISMSKLCQLTFALRIQISERRLLNVELVPVTSCRHRLETSRNDRRNHMNHRNTHFKMEPKVCPQCHASASS